MSSFLHRHIGPDAIQQTRMLDRLGLSSLDELVDKAMPAAIRVDDGLSLPAGIDEAAALERLRSLAARNNPGRAMIGLGYHGTITPAVIRRNILENPAWYTAYTPYQPEISQGRLEMLLNFQTMVADLTGLPLAGASLLDEATAVAEGVAMARRAVRSGQVVLVDPGLLPASLAVLRTRMDAAGIEIVIGGDDLAADDNLARAFCVVVQTPTADGRLQSTAELAALAEAAHAVGAQLVAAADLLALTLVTPPGEWGADIAVGSTQRFGVPLFYGGPHAGYIAARAGAERRLPGRLVGVSTDADGAPALRLALQTREQHIRREKATSNICTAQVLLAVTAAAYALYHGPEGLREIATGIHLSARQLAGALRAAGAQVVHESFFDTLLVGVPDADQVVRRARAAGIHLRRVDAGQVGVSIGEDATDDDLVAVAQAFGAEIAGDQFWGGLAADARTSEYLTHPVFGSHHSETSLMRYLRSLADRDFALDRGMIPLGSCTMKLNSAAELEPISYPGFAGLHPFVPDSDAQGMHELIDELSGWLAEISGYDKVSLQPNSGAQGEFAGLMAIRRYYRARGEDGRTVCLIPSSAHGTNAASATMAGLKVVVVKATEDGSIDLDDLRAKVAANAGRLAAIMITYPSTHGVFEDTISTACELVHSAGGQVYVDGANMNALVGLARPGKFGADVSHLNLHKTFAIPHGGGGPGVGPIAVRAHLAPYLPDAEHPVSESAFGSAGVLPITYAYIAMMGADGLRQASQVALLNANYIAKVLNEAFPVLYTGQGGLVAHECIIDPRAVCKHAGLTIDDIAKRLIDYGFHAPTMSFPVPGTLMIEPTESEDQRELDRFCDAMIAIRAEIDLLIAGEWPHDDNPLVNAPHTLGRCTADEWTHPYSRRLAAYPAGRSTGQLGPADSQKYWPWSARIDNAYGDRHLMCTCPPVADYVQ
ncbi:MAG: aminomethyl-transferring glycine dehydrogenase [Propionibacterium sp.]|nr:aminomethyl-transferring glycine dehydrogenase [Propionibacterium sp.]